MSAVEVIDLLSDDENDAPATSIATRKRRPAFNSNSTERRNKQKHSHGSQQVVYDLDSDSGQKSNGGDEISIVEPPSSSATLPTLSSCDTCNNDDDDDDVCLVGATGKNALEDYPHARESCVKHPFQVDPMLFCSCCYCFVCDVVASQCSSWNQHCHATYGDAKWRKMRDEHKKKTKGQVSSANAAAQPPVRRPQAPRRRQEPYLQNVLLALQMQQSQLQQLRQQLSQQRSQQQQQQQLPQELQRLKQHQAAHSRQLRRQLDQQLQLLRQHQRRAHNNARRPPQRPTATTRPSQAPSVAPAAPQPSVITSTVYLNMSSEEQASFGYASLPPQVMDRYANGGSLVDIQQALSKQTAVASSKIHALVNDLNALCRSQPTFKAIVYTQSNAMQRACVARLGQEGYSVYCFSSCASEPREEIVNEFRNANEGAAVAVILVEASVANYVNDFSSAARVLYMMEPHVDPAIESKVRLNGKPFKTFVFRYSIESNIVELHKEISSGRIALEGDDKSFLPAEASKILFKGITSSGGSDSGSRLLDV